MAVQSVSNDASSNVFLQDFLRLLLGQMTNQDPLKPMDNQQFLAQMAQFTTLQQTQQLNQQMSQVMLTGLSNQAISLLNKTVSAISGDQVITGQVTRISFQEGQPLLQLTTPSGVVSGITLSALVNVQ